MEKIIDKHIYKINMDYEFILSGGSRKLKEMMISEFEYIFFFIDNGRNTLFSNRTYTRKYLEHTRKLGLNPCETINHLGKKVRNWWGELSSDPDELKLEKKLNSQFQSFIIARENNLCPVEVQLIFCQEDLHRYMSNNIASEKFVLKREFGFSGNGIRILKDPSNEKIEFPILISPYYNRILDLGISFNIENASYFFTVNYINEKGRFLGGSYFSNEDELKEKYDFININDLKKSSSNILNILTKIGVKKYVEVDMFYYKSEKEILLYSMVEINYRRTMGTMIRALSKRFPSEYSAWLIFPQKKINKTRSYLLEKDFFTTSPLDNFFHSMFLKARDKESLTMLLSRYREMLEIDSDDEFFVEIENNFSTML